MAEALRLTILLKIKLKLQDLIKDAQKLLESFVSDSTATISGSKLHEAQVISSKLEVTIHRANNDITKYLEISEYPDAEEISDLSTVQLEADDILCELQTKMKIQQTTENRKSNNFVSGKLPKLDLPQFDGNILEFSTFWDQFQCNIHNRNLSDVDKLLYLKASLRGKAKDLVNGLETTNKNYHIAIESLKTQFGKTSQIIDAHYSALHKIKTADNTIQDCRKVYNDLETHLRVLQSLGEDTDHNHLRFLVMEKFPKSIIYELKLKMKDTTIKDIRENLGIIITAREETNRLTEEGKDNEANYTVETLYTSDMQNRRADFPLKPKGKFEEQNRHFNNRQGNNKEHKNRQNDFKSNERFRQHGKKRPFTINTKSENYVPESKKMKPSCIFCNEHHFNDECDKIKTLEGRKESLNRRCFSCLRKGHNIRFCKLKRVCPHCEAFGKHNRALCPKKCGTHSDKKEKTNTFHVNEKGLTVLQTAVVTAVNETQGTHLPCRILLDSGSQRSYITKEVADKLKLEVIEHCKLTIFTFGNKNPQEIDSPVVQLQLQTRTNRNIRIYANIVPTIAQNIPYPEKELSNFAERQILADDGSLTDAIDILIGNDYYFSIMLTEKIEIKENLYLVNSDLGWILSGRSDYEPIDELSVVTYFQAGTEYKLHKPDLPIDQGSVAALWDLESIGISDNPKANRDEEAVNNFNETTKVVDNRYSVSWPWIDYPPALSSNYGLAYGRLVNLLKRMDGQTLKDYIKTLQDQIDKGIIEIVQEPNKEQNHPVHYLPHHYVNQKGKPIRIVYDASSKIKDSKSLNECLYRGPLMLEDLTGLLIRFRYHQVALSADVEKAFLQLALNSKDRDVTRFLWLKDVTKPPTKDNIICMRFCRVPFGVISSPFLLNATIRHHLSNCAEPEIRDMANQIYVDNLITGTPNVESALQLYEKSKKAFDQISMNLREWGSNSEAFMNQIPDGCQEQVIKILGLDWNLRDDDLQLRIRYDPNASTKREVLKIIASIYDPCGFVVPYVLSAKLFLQELWKNKIKWDAKLSKEMIGEWMDICKHLDEIKEVRIPRCYMRHQDDQEYHLHCFCDASLKAYAAVVYLVHGGQISFIIGKSRLVPIKDQESLKIPRLELLAAVIGSRLIKFVIKSLPVTITQQTLWSDSQIVIEWCKSNKLLPPFVSRRTHEIRQNKNLTIRFVPTELNVADVATRPTSDEKEKWLVGPKFLLEHDNRGQPAATSLVFLSREVPSEETNTQNDTEETAIESETNNNQEKVNKVNNKIEELKKLQAVHFPQELEDKETSLKRNLGLFLDVDGLLRCKGRLKNTDWPYDKRYPILIPKDCDFTNDIIIQTHNDNYHVGANHTLSIIREKFWIPQGKSQVLKILRKCPRCVKHGGGPFKLPPTPALPPERVNYSSPFTFTGLDLLGPVLIKAGNTTSKCWIALFTCLAVRAVHLEIVQDLTAEEGLLALRRMIATRGVPQLITSDNATNFKLMSEVLANSFCIKNEITWRFIPQLAPWFGGFYERLVGIVKNCLKRTLQKHLLSNSQLSTIIKEVEAVINSRPLTCVDTELIHVLKPSDFLTVGRCVTVEKSDDDIPIQSTATKSELIKGWKRGLTILEEFKDMFSNHYLLSLRGRYGHSVKEPKITSKLNPCVGQVVQIKGDTKNREGWKVGRIVSLQTGADGLSRIAKVKVGNKEFVRSLAHLYPLEVEEEKESDYIQIANNEKTIDTNQITQIELEPPEIEVSTTESTENKERESRKSETRVEDENSLKEADNVTDAPHEKYDINEQLDESVWSEKNEENTRQRRSASLRALEKIREWTRNLLTLL